VECEQAFGLVFIRFEPGGPSLAEMLAPAASDLELYRMGDLRPLRRIAASPLQTNWKNATDNYIDALHIRVAHRGLDSLVGESYGLRVQDGAYKLWGSIETLGRAGASVRAYVKHLPDVEHLPATHKREWRYYQLWPNLAFNLYPDMVEFMQFLPVSPTSTLLRDASYGLPDARREMRVARALNHRINRQVGREDKDLVERVQAGMRSRSYTQGPLGRNEVCLRHFAARLRETLPVSRLPVAPAPGTIAAVNAQLQPVG
jgi:phenylpropionate dioxygenase-like ring-hydroxylating dioxygenase large terminal subunit